MSTRCCGRDAALGIDPEDAGGVATWCGDSTTGGPDVVSTHCPEDGGVGARVTGSSRDGSAGAGEGTTEARMISHLCHNIVQLML